VGWAPGSIEPKGHFRLGLARWRILRSDHVLRVEPLGHRGLGSCMMAGCTFGIRATEWALGSIEPLGHCEHGLWTATNFVSLVLVPNTRV